MPKNLVIVESPAKAKTIQKFLGKDFAVESSYGHIVDLPKKGMGIDIDNNFLPNYEVTPDKKAVVKKLKDLSKKAEMIWLASDEDREGEAISWHLYNELGLKPNNTKRIVFHEITKKAIQNAVENPRQIDVDLVNAQQARRILDRLVGFEVSPILWRKVRAGLSAGRVQSVAVRLIVEREKTIQTFTPQSSFKFVGEFITNSQKPLKANLTKTFESYQEAQQFLESCIGAKFDVSDLQKKPAKRTPSAPFTTSTLQQEASRKLGFSVSRTMRVAQQLYEAGLITYMRTDSVNLSNDAIQAAQQMIESKYGVKYHKKRQYSTKNKSAQEAHEAIRPTNMQHAKAGFDDSQTKLYSLIWKRTVASQMADAELERTIIDINNNQNQHKFQAKGEVIVFDGFLTLYQESTDDDADEEQEGLLPKVQIGEPLSANQITGTERFTKHMPRYTEASLVKKLEELGIGRPSTYAPTISTIQKRNYVEIKSLDGQTRAYQQISLANQTIKTESLTETYGADKRKLMPTDIGIVVNDFLVEHFNNILDYHFTAKVEADFDKIAQGKEDWTQVLQSFYTGFHDKVEDVKENAERASGERLLGQDPKSGKNVYAKIGRYGPMVQIGEAEDEEKPRFASLLKDQQINSITLEQALNLFQLPKLVGQLEGEDVFANVGRFGPYVKFKEQFVSVPQEIDIMSISIEQATALIQEKQKQDAPILSYENHDVTKGKGRFGPFIKWNNMFINVSKKYDFDALSEQDIIELIEAKKKKEIEKVVHHWESDGIRVEKARWGRHNIIQGKIKIEIGKDIDAKSLTLDEVKNIIQQKAPKTKKASPKRKAKK